MDLQQAKILLEKINALHNSISLDKGDMSAIERDLMLSYVRQLYESYLPGNAQQKVAPIEKAEIKTPEPPPVEPPKKKYVPPKIIEIPDSLKDLKSMGSKTPVVEKPKPTPKPTPVPKIRVEEPVKVKKAAKPVTGKVSAEVMALFQFKQAKELSEKLSERPVTDLTKAMAINDRLLYMNELFGKDANALTESLKLLNKYDNMDEAQGLLFNLADQYNWTDDEKVGTARAFIQLIRRRYI